MVLVYSRVYQGVMNVLAHSVFGAIEDLSPSGRDSTAAGVGFLLRRGYLHCGTHSLIYSRLCACPSAHLSFAQAMCPPRRVSADTRSCARVLHMDTHTHMSSSQDVLAAVLTPRPQHLVGHLYKRSKTPNCLLDTIGLTLQRIFTGSLAEEEVCQFAGTCCIAPHKLRLPRR